MLTYGQSAHIYFKGSSMTDSSFTKTPGPSGYGGFGWRVTAQNSGRGQSLARTIADAAARFGEGDTVNHTLDERLKDGKVTLVDQGNIHVTWPSRLADHYHPGVLTITKKAEAATAKEQKRYAKKK
jgi:hypothetical protein